MARRARRLVSRKQPCACVRNRSYKSLLALPDLLAGCSAHRRTYAGGDLRPSHLSMEAALLFEGEACVGV